MDLIGTVPRKSKSKKGGVREDLPDKRDIVFRLVGNGNRGCLDKVDESTTRSFPRKSSRNELP